MKKLTATDFAFAAFLASFALSAFGQPINQTARRAQSAAALPATCNSTTGVKDVFIASGAWYICTAANTWTLVGPGGAPGYPLLAPDGTAAAPSYSFTNNSNLGLFRSAANLLGIAVAGVEQWDVSQTCFCPFANNTEDIGNGSVNPRDVNAARNLNAAGIVSSGDGGVNSASFQFASEPTLGLFRSGAGQLGITSAGTIGWFSSTGYHGFGTIVEAFNDSSSSADGFVIDSNGTASAGTQKRSPRLRFTGQGWKTDATAASQTVDWIAEAIPVQGTAAPTSTLTFSSQINAGGYTADLTLGSAGTLQTLGNVGIATAPSATTGVLLDALLAGNQSTIIQVRNTDAADTVSKAMFKASADTAILQLQSEGTAANTSRFSVTNGGYNEVLGSAGNGLLIGTTTAKPTIIGSNSIAGVNFDGTTALPTFPLGSTMTGALTVSQTAGIVGTTTNNNANAGSFGEYQTGTVAANTTSLSTGTTANVGANTNITLTAGDWDCSGVVNFTFGATTSITNLAGGISTTTGTLPAQDSYFDFETSAIIPTGTAVATWVVPTVRLSNTGSTNVFLVSQATFTASTLKVGGTIRCRRMR